MGGCATCQRVSHEESSISTASCQLGFDAKDVREVDNTIRKYSTDTQVNELQFKALCKMLGLTSNAPANALYSSFRDTEGIYSRNSLIVLGVLLSQGRTDSKARILFEAYDNVHKGVISSQELSRLLGEMMNITASLLPNLVAEVAGVQDYALKCRNGIPEAEAELKRFLLEGEQATRSHFVARLSELQSGCLLSASGLRAFLLTLGRLKVLTRVS
jgi:Ca2+-binding EF-hand superfamily protein